MAAAKSTRKSPPKPKVTKVTKAKAPAAPAPPPAEERDYLVVFEEPDPYGLPSDDVLVLDIDTQRPQRPEVDVQQKLDLELTNTTSRLGTFGFVVNLVGAAIGVILMIIFPLVYPQDLNSGNASVMRFVILTAVFSVALMIAGTVLTHYGRRIQARGQLSDVRIIEKSSQNRVKFD